MSDIHDLFHDNDTADPSTNGWAEEVRTRHRRNRVLTGVAAGVLAVGLAIPVGVTLVNRSGGTPVASPAKARLRRRPIPLSNRSPAS